MYFPKLQSKERLWQQVLASLCVKHAKSICLKLIVMVELPNIYYQLYLEFQRIFKQLFKIKLVLMELLHRVALLLWLLESFNKFEEFDIKLNTLP